MMVEEDNIVSIEDFPEVSSLVSSDKIIVFSENSDGSLSPEIRDLSSFSDLIASNNEFQELQSSFAELSSLEIDLEKELSSAYATSEYVSANYSTIDLLNSSVNKIKKTDSLMNDLENRATKEYLEVKYQQILKSMQDLKRLLGTAAWKTDDQAYGYKVVLAAKAKGGGGV